MYRRRMALSEICRRLKVNRKLVYRTLKRGTTNGLPRTGRPVTVTTARMKKIVKKCLERSPCRSMKKMATEPGVSRKNLHRTVEDKLGMRAYKIRKLHGLSDNQRAARVKKCRALFERAVGGGHMRMLFTDEKLFTIEQIDKNVYLEVLKNHLLPWAIEHYENGDWILQQDGTPAHRSTSTQDWCLANLPDFISASEWPANSPDLNVLDFSIWAMLKRPARKRTPVFRLRGSLWRKPRTKSHKITCGPRWRHIGIG
ncbi:hypothetical protein Y032_0020g162 [Ancylostoma ceylanicum]|uniref:Tc1-like transposase DDE domain-containing protein n=1 Tax=Ancylostoma ceylanicum TaxID=53326 RepID=A0A016V2M7_9BILA|nr:hypothetical protein Y032_0020g162 [Ancylostoma ceylanicum]